MSGRYITIPHPPSHIGKIKIEVRGDADPARAKPDPKDEAFRKWCEEFEKGEKK